MIKQKLGMKKQKLGMIRQKMDMVRKTKKKKRSQLKSHSSHSLIKSSWINVQKEVHLREEITTAQSWSIPSGRDKLVAANIQIG